MAKPTLDQLRSMSDFAVPYRWNLSFDTFPAAIAAPPDTEALNLRCESSVMPSRTNQNFEVPIRGLNPKQAGISSVNSPIDFTLVETVDNTVSQFLKDWEEAVYDLRTGASSPQSDLTCIITITRLDNEDNGIFEFVLYGAFLESGDYGGTLDGSTSDALRPTLSIAYDYYETASL